MKVAKSGSKEKGEQSDGGTGTFHIYFRTVFDVA